MKAIVTWRWALNFTTFKNADCACDLGIGRKLSVYEHSTRMQVGASPNKWLIELRN